MIQAQTAEVQERGVPGWKASLDLRLRPSAGRTVLACLHHGPLRVQKPFYPEGDACHVYLLHPPGGLVGGDEVDVRVLAQAGAAGLVTTPGAGKFYRSAGALAFQSQELVVEAGGCLEWLPQETIVYPGAQARSLTRVQLAQGARFMGWEIVCLGLPESGETFGQGAFDQRLEVHREGQPLLMERCRYHGGSALLEEPWGLAGRSVFGTLLATWDHNAPLDELRAVLSDAGSPGSVASVTVVDGILACRVMGHEARQVRGILRRAWTALRQPVTGRTPCPPRIWNT